MKQNELEPLTELPLESVICDLESHLHSNIKAPGAVSYNLATTHVRA